ncbi:phosphatidylglycerophosphatase A family protein [Marinicella gelatinilytica]|uniref:phosphatidylglycerophosphatase A family protein n=1 Tax=Marinicella gelatinilytica TaxID=2996017 RepID=UPI002260C5C6|nr:phosphatidylglycerophosphatase A [Marinicella gelatinilytica]MCX7545292.1 phosphatidylglycerophosphatase A [Marinicella gelatinilytica]
MNKTQKIALTTPSGFLAFGFGSGLAPVAPGTFGTLMAIPLYLALQTLPPLMYLAVVVAAFIGGVWICGRAGKALGVHDHGGIVWDEFVGFWITMWLVPFHWTWLLAGFILFRLFDIVKPFPIGWIDKKVSGGFGVMIDDVVAGIYAWLILMLARYFL